MVTSKFILLLIPDFNPSINELFLLISFSESSESLFSKLTFLILDLIDLLKSLLIFVIFDDSQSNVLGASGDGHGMVVELIFDIPGSYV